MFGPLPVGVAAFEGPAHTLVGDRFADNPLLAADFGSQLPGPGSPLVAELAWAAVQQVFEAFGRVCGEGRS
jgi:hypothetical protein